MSTSAAVRQRMTHRALVERDGQTAVDGYGAGGVPAWQTHIAVLPCFFYVEQTRTANDEIVQRGITVQENLRMIVPLGTDITERDRINGVSKRDGTAVYAEVMNVLSVTPHHDHLEVRVGSAV